MDFFKKNNGSFLLPWISILMGLILFCVACETGGSIKQGTIKAAGLQEADNHFDRGQYQTALLKYSGYIYSPFPNKIEIEYARYKLGLCQFFLGQYHEAHDTLLNLLKNSPNFQYQAEANEILARCVQKVEIRNQEKSKQLVELQQTIQKTEQYVAQNADSAEAHYRLGGLYWNAGRISDAITAYERATQLDRNYLAKSDIRERVRITGQGEFRPRTPLLEFDRERPVVVTNANLDRVEREDWLGQYHALRLSGEVENRGLRDVRNVQIEVSIYDFFGTVQDAKVVYIGNLRAGGRRPFTALFTEYSGQGYNISKYKAEVYYDE